MIVHGFAGIGWTVALAARGQRDIGLELATAACQTRRRQDAEDKVARQTVTIERLQAQVAHEQDEHPATPVSVQPAVGDARLVQLLDLAERARRHLDQQCLDLHWTTVVQEREILQLREQIAEEQAVNEALARQINDMATPVEGSAA
ncbi:hypothetical protein EASAB2608_06257 [Streptomyces sp. EAS-AB2608]|uniref:hypothetical protein n=1 Tax=Streptomyces sp. EAS-AB2608 TaxID=2779671 RepID=UPI001BEFC9D9|nr:hypothetical protein [Streptomyces sp. EAS-AB2608]BCM70923.1 hypothetical protein EASAB2608_06257 [Streptomyces sp. EAS-AB2608]